MTVHRLPLPAATRVAGGYVFALNTATGTGLLRFDGYWGPREFHAASRELAELRWRVKPGDPYLLDGLSHYSLEAM